MEEKVYQRQVLKLTTAKRVVDEQQIDRHFAQTELSQLYAFNPASCNQIFMLPENPADDVLSGLVSKYADLISNWNWHDSLLQENSDEDLSNEERNEAWGEFEKEEKTAQQHSFSRLTGKFHCFSLDFFEHFH